MGNQSSNEGGRSNLRFLRQSNALGLSKSELDARCRPSGLYPSCHWEDKAIRRLIGDGKLAARLKGSETRTAETDQECPICFLHYPEINVTKCCQAVLCTECYLQVKPQKDRGSCCPFCNHSKLQVSVAHSMDKKEIQERQKAEQRALEAQIRSRSRSTDGTPKGCEAAPESALADATNTATTTPTNKQSSPNSPGGFGSSLEQNHRVALLRARSESMNSEPSSGGGGAAAAAADTNNITALAMTPDERRALEAEMRSQHSHPLAQRLQAEESQRRMQNELEYYRNRRRNAPRNGSRGRDWNRIVDAFENGGNGPVQSLDDLVVLEAAIMLSMQEEEERRNNGSDGNDNNNDNNNNTASGMASSSSAAAAAEGGGFDAAHHASRGFPLARERVQRPPGNSSSSSNNNSTRRARNNSSPALEQETQTMVMRGMSEEEQLAMAIAASLEERSESASNAPSETPSSAASNAGNTDE